ncbi:LacI family DNA-binding transcriptional regulator [Rubellimicrobium roseum]|uniref:LacI family transcriptional regulator n=1 Tax=Rubellimicrobium roseum TaxID=687525 RepID=A0A5C4N6Q2_9RHOB|nr:LacI family DNA-binding transcriptional regulator [Rubellimicrobium roseum]TNC66621.1 LacI family transcriptional regulator [Rubellimicrobium roseum]
MLVGDRIRLSDVARAAGVSLATASKALNGSGRMTAETRERVRQAAEAMGFRPNAMARALSSQRSFTVGLLTNDGYGRFSMPVMAGVAEALVDQGVSVFMCGIEDDAALGRLHVEAMLDKQVDGIICSGKRIDRRLPVDLSDLPVPVVYVFTDAPEGAVSLVSDDAQGAREAAEWLAGLGRRRLAHVTGPASFASARERARVFREVTGPDSTVLHGAWSEAWGHEAVARLWDGSAPPPDGLFCGNDQIARGAVDALRERGVAVPGDVSVVGFDNWEIVAAATRPPLTSIDMNLKDLGREAGRLMLALSEGRAVEPGVRRQPCRLVVRQSCGGGSAR